jgi:hypothetical protein
MAGAVGQVRIKGLKELGRAFQRMDKALVKELVEELKQAAEPVKERTSQYIVSGGGGFPAMRGIAARPGHWEDMRVGASRSLGSAWVAPAWRSSKGTLQGQILAVQFRFRMEGALEDESDAVQELVDKWLGELGREWERAA